MHYVPSGNAMLLADARAGKEGAAQADKVQATRQRPPLFASLVPRLRNSVGDLHGQHLFFTPIRTDAWITVDYEVS